MINCAVYFLQLFNIYYVYCCNFFIKSRADKPITSVPPLRESIAQLLLRTAKLFYFNTTTQVKDGRKVAQITDCGQQKSNVTLSKPADESESSIFDTNLSVIYIR